MHIAAGISESATMAVTMVEIRVVAAMISVRCICDSQMWFTLIDAAADIVDMLSGSTPESAQR